MGAGRFCRLCTLVLRKIEVCRRRTIVDPWPVKKHRTLVESPLGLRKTCLVKRSTLVEPRAAHLLNLASLMALSR